MTYNRKIKMFDESHSPEVLESLLKSGEINKGKFLTSAHKDSYLLQMTIINSLNCKKVLEIGPGEQFVARNLRELGYIYHTLDILESHNPTFISSLMDFDEGDYLNEYDIVCAFQVLEHMPYEDFNKCLMKMTKIAKRYIVISVPFSCKGYRKTHTEYYGQNNSNVLVDEEHFEPTNLPNRKYRKEYMLEFPWAVHYWEIGRQGFPLERIQGDIESCGLKILRQFHARNPFHYFMVMERLLG